MCNPKLIIERGERYSNFSSLRGRRRVCRTTDFCVLLCDCFSLLHMITFLDLVFCYAQQLSTHLIPIPNPYVPLIKRITLFLSHNTL